MIVGVLYKHVIHAMHKMVDKNFRICSCLIVYLETLRIDMLYTSEDRTGKKTARFLVHVKKDKRRSRPREGYTKATTDAYKIRKT